MSIAQITTDHDKIRQWAETRGGKPAKVKATGGGSDPGLLRIDFPEHGGKQTLEEISWDDFFNKFEEKKLAFLFQEQTAEGKESRFFKLISREKTAAREQEKKAEPAMR